MAYSEPRIQQNYSVPNTNGSTIAFNNIGSAPIQILGADAAHDDFILVNPGDAPVLVYQALDTEGASLAPTFAAPGGGIILGSGESAEVTGEAAQGEWLAVARAGDPGSLTVYIRSSLDRFGIIDTSDFVQTQDIGKTVQAHSENLDTLADVAPGDAGLAILADDTEQDVRDYLDPFKGFAADGVTDDTANFTALRAIYPDTDFDLRGKVYRVTAIPDGPFHNGKWRIFGAGEGGGNIDYPAPGTYKYDAGKISDGERMSAWPQDACHPYNNVVYSLWKEGADHEAADVHVRMARSFDNGLTWNWYENLFQSTVGARSCWAAAAVGGGMQVLAVREHTGPHDDDTIVGTRLYQRRLGERREKKNYPDIGNFTNMEIIATSGSSTVRVANCARHGLRQSEIINITNVVGTVGGLTISGEYTVAGRGADWFEFTHPSGPASSSQTNTSDFTVDFVESAAFREITVDGTTLSEAVRAFAGSPYAGTVEFYFHSMVDNPDDNTGGFWIGVTGGGQLPHIAYIDNVYYASCRVVKLVPINLTGRGEPTIKRLPNGTLFGFLRNNSPTSTGGFFYSTDGGNSFTTRLNVSGAGNDFQYSPIPCATDGTNIYAVATGNRVRGTAGQTLAGDVPLYLLEGNATDVLTNGWAALSITRIGSITFANESQGDTGNGVGVGSIVYNNGVLHIFESTENAENRAKPFGAPDILNIRIQLVDDVPAYAKGVQELVSPRVELTSRGERNRLVAGRFFGWGAAYLMGRVNSNGTIARGHGITVTKGGTGVYDVTFATPLPTDDYYVFATAYANGNVYIAQSAAQTVNGFQIATRNGASAGALTDAAWSYIIFANHQFTRTDWSRDVTW